MDSHQKEQLNIIINSLNPTGKPMTEDDERRHKEMAEALGVDWLEYLELNPSLIQRK